MRLSLSSESPATVAADAWVTGVWEAVAADTPFPRALAELDHASGGAISGAWKSGELKGKRKEITVFHRTSGGPRIVLVGLGPRNAHDAEGVRRAAAEAIRSLAGRGVTTAAYDARSFVAGRVDLASAVRSIVDGAVLGSYRFTKFKSKFPDTPVAASVIVVGPKPPRAVTAAFAEEETLTGVVTWTRDVANLPPNEATPARLAEIALELGKSHELKVTVLDEKQLEKLGCGGLLAVGSGSSHPPRLIALEYPGQGANAPTIAVVGKGITFDSGGISIKPAPSMSYMKFDKSGAVAVLGILRAARALRVRPRVVGIMACAENLPSGSSYRPGDVVRTYSGKTIEVLNTDAEGRVALSDALAYAAKNYDPAAMIDLATLTGAQTVALGDTIAGLVTKDDGLAERLRRASAATGEAIWRMPLTDYHRELVRAADFGDVRNSVEIPLAGMLTAAAFLETFVDDRPWAHLDIAGPAYTTLTTRKYQPAYLNVGAVGFGVRLLSRFLLDYVPGKGRRR